MTTWGAKMEIPRDFLNYGIERGALLAFAAERAIGLINERTDKGLDVGGRPFAPYAVQKRVAREAGGQGWIVRGARGRWREATVRGPLTPVRLRGLSLDAQPGKRMRDNLTFSPAFPRRDQRQVVIAPSGSRQRRERADGPADEHGVPAYTMRSVRHSQTARWVQYGHANVPRGSTPGRPWIGLTADDRAAVVAALRALPSAAWLDTHRKAKVAAYQKRAKAALKRQARALKKGDEAKAARAAAAHEAFVAELRSMGMAE